MEEQYGAIEVTIPSRGFLRLRDSKGCAVHVKAGQVWVTEEGNLRDTLLDAGMPFRIGHEGLTLLQAYGEVRVAIYPARTAAHGMELAAVRPASRSKRLKSLWISWWPLLGLPRKVADRRATPALAEEG